MTTREYSQSPPHEYFVDLAQRLPKIAYNQWTPVERKNCGHTQYLNNFYCLFDQRSRLQNDPQAKKEDLYKVNAMIDRYPDQWKTFLRINPRLIVQIDQKIEELNTYTELFSHYLALIKEGNVTNDYTKMEEFGPLIESTAIYTWRQLNTFLKKADERLKVLGVNTYEFS